MHKYSETFKYEVFASNLSIVLRLVISSILVLLLAVSVTYMTFTGGHLMVQVNTSAFTGSASV